MEVGRVQFRSFVVFPCAPQACFPTDCLALCLRAPPKGFAGVHSSQRNFADLALSRHRAATKRDSELLFPSETGGFRSHTVLDKPFKDICKHLKLGKKVTPKAMRRTFQDLARRAEVNSLVQRSICGYLTEEMTERYSSVAQVEVQAALGKVVSLAGYRELLGETAEWCESGVKPVLNEKEPLAAAPQATETNQFSGSGIPGSNRRHSAWEADTLPTELIPRVPPLMLSDSYDVKHLAG